VIAVEAAVAAVFVVAASGVTGPIGRIERQRTLLIQAGSAG
jgi:hypothetical protein